MIFSRSGRYGLSQQRTLNLVNSIPHGPNPDRHPVVLTLSGLGFGATLSTQSGMQAVTPLSPLRTVVPTTLVVQPTGTVGIERSVPSAPSTAATTGAVAPTVPTETNPPTGRPRPNASDVMGRSDNPPGTIDLNDPDSYMIDGRGHFEEEARRRAQAYTDPNTGSLYETEQGFISQNWPYLAMGAVGLAVLGFTVVRLRR